MVKHEFSLLETGCKNVEEYIEAFFYEKNYCNVRQSIKNIRKEYCDRCRSMNCEGCFICDCLTEINN